MTDRRTQIIQAYAGWTALSALRSGSPVKSRAAVYALIAHVPFDAVLELGARGIDEAEFERWHREAVDQICEDEPKICVGWAAKIVNVYLKTAVYVGGLGREGLVGVIHPPVDGGLWAGVQRNFATRPDILRDTHVVKRIRDITNYETYARIISGMRRVAAALGCSLIEVDVLWEGATDTSPNTAPELTPIMPLCLPRRFRVSGSHRRRGSAFGR